MKSILMGAALALALTPAAVWAEDFHCPKPGTVITFTDGTTTITGQEGMNCATTKSKQFLGITSIPTDLEQGHADRLFPLQVGKEIEFTSKQDSSHLSGSAVIGSDIWFMQNNVKVVREEKITTKAGTFDTFVIEWHKQALGRLSGAWLSTIWFAPELGYRVKGTYETRAGNGANGSYEITSLTLPSPSTTVTAPTPTPTPTPATPVATVTPPVRTPVPAAPAPVAKAAPTTAPVPAHPLATSVEDRLNSLKDLLDRKVITPDEYAAKRKEILKSL